MTNESRRKGPASTRVLAWGVLLVLTPVGGPTDRVVAFGVAKDPADVVHQRPDPEGSDAGQLRTCAEFSGLFGLHVEQYFSGA